MEIKNNPEAIKQFFYRLKAQKYGLVELVAIHKDTRQIIGTGFFNHPGYFTAACCVYNRQCHIYAGRNPRPGSFCQNSNTVHTGQKRRARDTDIEFVTAISLDIDPIRPKQTPSSTQQHKTAIRFALDLQSEFGGYVDDSGNGAYLWIPFLTPIQLDRGNVHIIKDQFRIWHRKIIETYHPERLGIRIDGCYDFSRIKRVIGTYNHTAGRLSRFVREGTPCDRVRDQILSITTRPRRLKKAVQTGSLPTCLPKKFLKLLNSDKYIYEQWNSPDPAGDRSRHDWMLGLRCIDAGILDQSSLAAILMHNPHGKFRRDRRKSYLDITVQKLSEEAENIFA